MHDCYIESFSVADFGIDLPNLNIGIQWCLVNHRVSKKTMLYSTQEAIAAPVACHSRMKK